MSFIPAGVLADFRGIINTSLSDSATIIRTNVTVTCRVADDRRDERLEGLPHFVRIRRWRIVMPDGQDVTGGDTITVPGKGTYYVLDTANPTSYSVDTTAFCVMTRDASGALSFPTNVTVTFTNPQTTAQPISARVILHEVSRDLEQWAYSAGYRWEVLFDAALVYTDGQHIGADHEVTWTDGMGVVRTGLMTKPRTMTQELPFALAYMTESP